MDRRSAFFLSLLLPWLQGLSERLRLERIGLGNNKPFGPNKLLAGPPPDHGPRNSTRPRRNKSTSCRAARASATTLGK